MEDKKYTNYGEFDIYIEDVNDVEEVMNAVGGMFKNRWETENEYTVSNLKMMKSKKAVKFPKELDSILEYAKLLLAEGQVFEFEVESEINKWEGQGMFCHFMSVLILSLVEKENPKLIEKMSFYQGYYLLKAENPFSVMLFGETQTGAHVWLTYLKTVIDATSSQHKSSITLPENEYGMVIGEYPKSYELRGVKESQAVVRKYQERFAADRGMELAEWQEWHLKKYKEFLNKKTARTKESEI